jgi:hypothetical protein
MSAPTVPELRWYLAYELRVEIGRVTIERPAPRHFQVRVRGPLSVPAHADMERLRRVVRSLVEPTTRVELEEVSDG